MRKVLIEKEGDEYVVYEFWTDDVGSETSRRSSDTDSDYAGKAALELAERLGIGIDRVVRGQGVPDDILEEGRKLKDTLKKLER